MNIIKTIKELWSILFGEFDIGQDWVPTQEEVDKELYNKKI